MLTLKQIQTRITELEQMIRSKSKALSLAPRGMLWANPRNGVTHFDYFDPDSAKRRRLSATDKQDLKLLRALAQRDYDQRILSTAEKELRILKKLVPLYSRGNPESIYTRLIPARQELVTPIYPTDKQYADAWLEKYLPESRSLPENTGFKSERGEYVRSKSELMIANMLLLRDPYYIYEKLVTLTDHLTGERYPAHPDFFVLNTRTRKAYLWEHLGKMGDAGYVETNINKLIDYAQAGYILGKNLIITMETKHCPLLPETIETVIEEYFL